MLLDDAVQFVRCAFQFSGLSHRGHFHMNMVPDRRRLQQAHPKTLYSIGSREVRVAFSFATTSEVEICSRNVAH